MYDPEQNKFFTFVVPHGFNPVPKATVPAQVLTRGAGGGNMTFDSTGVAVEPATGDVWVSFYKIGYTGRLKVNEKRGGLTSFSEQQSTGPCRRQGPLYPLPGRKVFFGVAPSLVPQ